MKNEISDKNKAALDNCQLVLQRDYRRLVNGRKPTRGIKETSQLDKCLTLGERSNLYLLGTSFLPAAINLALGGIGIVGLILVSGATIGYDASTSQFIQYQKMASDTCNYAANRFEDCLKLLTLPAFFTVGTGSKRIFDSVVNLYDNKQYNERMKKYEDRMAVAIDIDDIIQLIKDIKCDRNDISLNFIKEFLSNVDLDENSEKFNLELLYRMAGYRVESLKNNDGTGSKKDIDDSFMGIVNLLHSASIDNGASSSFIENEYVKSLINRYYFEEESEDKKIGSTPGKKLKKIFGF